STAGRGLLAHGEDGAADGMRGLLPEPVDHVLAQPHLSLVAPGAPVSARSEEGAAADSRGLLPEPVDHVLAQPDLSLVAPGPLVSELADTLAVMADVESSGGATVFRVSEATCRRALDFGWSASDLHEFFARSSRTPIPQALDYLIDDVTRQHGRLRV